MTCHVLHAGDGYTYLTRQVASGDVTRSVKEELVAYYTAVGNPPGQWAGSACQELGMSGEVAEEQMLALFGEGLRPDANTFIADRVARGQRFSEALRDARLGRRYAQYGKDVPLVAALVEEYARFERANHRRASVSERRDIKVATARKVMAAQHPERPSPTRDEVRKYITDELGHARQPVAGFDLVFTPAKSVSLLWGLGAPEVRRIVAEVHEAAWRAALAYGERETAFTRVGAGGVAQVDTSGFVATAFLHRDSRAGDPDLHTHVAIANRVRAADGIWRTIDGQQVFAVAVSMSEVYNAAIEQGLTERLGVAWVDVDHGAGKRAVREVEGIPAEWIRGFSRRRQQVEAGYDDLVADYVRRHGHVPPRNVQRKLAQQATLTDRPDKQLRSLGEQLTDWDEHARHLTPGSEPVDVVAGCVDRTASPVDGDAVDLSTVASVVIDAVSTERATWTTYHVRAEAQRRLKPIRFPSWQARQEALEWVVTDALGQHSVPLSTSVDATPRLLQHVSGESVFHRRGSQRYTSSEVLDAEARLLEAGHTPEGPTVSPAALPKSPRTESAGRESLDAGQRELVRHFVTCGRALAVGIGPPGAGKSTAMRAVRQTWETTGGRVIGLAPSAAAASVLGDELGVRARTMHSLIAAHDGGARIDVVPGDMLLVDEAGMAGTRTLDAIRAIAEQHRAVVRLVGDHRQLAAVEAGGALRLLFHDIGGTELSELHRFRNPHEAAAVLAFRRGHASAIRFYADNGRLHGGVRSAMLDELYRDWRSDVAAGRAAIMISDSNDVVRELSERAQADSRAAGLAEPDGTGLHDGTLAGVGDRVVTRLNRRRLPVHGGRDYVKNGDLWQVTHRYRDGRLRVHHVRHHGTVVLPSWYVAEHTELGYAATIHRSQGLTVDVSRSFLSPSAVREAALVALSRGTDGNHAYLDTEQVIAPDEPDVLPGDLFHRHRNDTEAAAALGRVLAREGAERSATEELREGLDAPYRLDNLVPQYAYAREVYRGPSGAAEAEGWVRQALPRCAADITTDEAWPALRAILHQAHDAGADPIHLLTRRAAERPLENDPNDPARSVAQVRHFRITAEPPITHAETGEVGYFPGWLPTPPTPSDAIESSDDAELFEWLRHHADLIAQRVAVLGTRVAENPPAWTAHIGDLPHDPTARKQWLLRAGHVAAYRERYGIADDDVELLPGGHRGEQARSKTWLLTLLASAHAPTRPDASMAHVEQLRERASSLAGQLDAHPRSDEAAPDPAESHVDSAEPSIEP